MFKITGSEFGKVIINGNEITHDFIATNGGIEKRNKEVSRKHKAKYGHTPLTPEENIPWHCKNIIIGTGFYEGLPISPDFMMEAEKRGIQILVMDTPSALLMLEMNEDPETGFIIHLTC